MRKQALMMIVLLSSAPAWAAESAHSSFSARVGAKIKTLGKKLGVAVAPVRVEKTADGEPKLVRWSFKDGALIPKETIVALPGGGVFKRILSVEKGPDGKKRLRSDVIFKRGGRAKETKANLRSVSLTEQKVTRSDVDTETGEATPRAEAEEEQRPDGDKRVLQAAEPAAIQSTLAPTAPDPKPASADGEKQPVSKEEKEERKERKLPEKLTMAGAYTRAVLASPVVHFAITTGSFFLFWRYAPQLVGYELDATQATMAAIGTKSITFPVVAYKAFKELRLKTKKTEEQPAEPGKDEQGQDAPGKGKPGKDNQEKRSAK